jgi:hypothetical protein
MIDAESLRAILSYNEETGLFMWRVPGRKRRLDRPVGTLLPVGYCQIKIFQRKYYAHRLAWLFIYGSWPPSEIDHINCDRSDNRISNLRLANPSTQGANVHKSKRNSSGFKGVSWDKISSKWRAVIGVQGKCLYLGRFDTAEMAHDAYCAAANSHFGCFARTS